MVKSHVWNHVFYWFFPTQPDERSHAKTHCQHNLRFGIVASKADSWAKTRRLRWLTRLPFFCHSEARNSFCAFFCMSSVRRIQNRHLRIETWWKPSTITRAKVGDGVFFLMFSGKPIRYTLFWMLQQVLHLMLQHHLHWHWHLAKTSQKQTISTKLS